MEAGRDYFDRKQGELAVIASALGRPYLPRPRTIAAVIEAKFRLAAELKARRARAAWGMTETNWGEAQSLQSGPFRFSYRYQRADLAVAGPLPYRPEGFEGATLEGPIYTCSGMAAISALLLALGTGKRSRVVFPPGSYKETLEFAASYVGIEVVCSSSPRHPRPGHVGKTILWLDSPPFGARAQELEAWLLDADLLVFDTTTFAAYSGRIGRLLRWARTARLPAVLVRSHTKLDTLGIEYGRLGSATFVSFPEVPLRKLVGWRDLARKMPEAVRLLGSAALPANFCPFIGNPAYRDLSSRRTAAMLLNGRLMGDGLTAALGERSVRRYAHGLFLGLIPSRTWTEADATAMAEQMAAKLTRSGVPARHAGSFGFDFVAIDGYFDSGLNGHVLRLAFADLPLSLCAHLAETSAAWWASRQRLRAA
jgi:hypothetical protein